jgi:hypothetical protein
MSLFFCNFTCSGKTLRFFESRMPHFEYLRPKKQELTEKEILEFSNGELELLRLDWNQACKSSVNYCSDYQLIFSTSGPLTINSTHESTWNQYTFQSNPKLPSNQSQS